MKECVSRKVKVMVKKVKEFLSINLKYETSFYCKENALLASISHPQTSYFSSHFHAVVTLQIPVSKVQTYGDLRNVLMKRIVLSALHFRINTRYKVISSRNISLSDITRLFCLLLCLICLTVFNQCPSDFLYSC